MKTEYLRVKDLKRILEKYNDEYPIIITKDGKGHQHGVNKSFVRVIEHPYFPDDSGNEFEKDKKFLQIAIV